jgi:predicted glycoside hydrolase/deacetylase ChbG (UPF0249 family)
MVSIRKGICMASIDRWLTAVAAVILLPISPITIHAQISASQVIQRLGYPPGSRLLIIHGDDFGVAHSVDRATEEALQKGWITSASIMVPCPWFPEAAQFAREHPEMDLGLHLTLTSEWIPYRWGPVSIQPAPSLWGKDGYLPPSEEEAAAQDTPADVAREIRAQIIKAQAAGVRFSHFDSHMGTLFQTPELFRLYQQAGNDNHIPTFIATKKFGQDGKGFSIMPDSVVLSGEFQMQPGVPLDQWLATYERALAALGPGLYQITVHLGYNDEELRAITSGKPDWWDAPWREADMKVVSSPDFRQFLREQGFVLVTWRQIANAEHFASTTKP